MQIAVCTSVATRHAGYDQLQEGVTCSTFGDLTVIANWQTAATYGVDRHDVAPQGYLARSADGSIVAGVFRGRFNGEALSAGEHFLVVERTPDVVTVHQPIGDATYITVEPPDAWTGGRGLRLQALDRSGALLAEAPYTAVAAKVGFLLQPSVSGQRVGRYQLPVLRSVSLPLILRNH